MRVSDVFTPGATDSPDNGYYYDYYASASKNGRGHSSSSPGKEGGGR